MAKTTRLMIRMDTEDREWIRAAADRLGVDSAALIRLLIRQARGISLSPVAGAPEAPRPAEDLDALMGQAERLFEPELEDAQPEPLPPKDDLAAYAEMLRAEPRYRFQQPRPESPARAVSPYHPKGVSRLPRQAPAATVPGAFRAGSMTRAVGVGDVGRQGNMMGDGVGNVTRDNAAHFGFIGTRSR